MEEWIKIGVVGVDSGQLMICDPCYIDSEWEKEEFKNGNDYFFIFPDGTEEKVEWCSKRWYQLINRVNSGELKLEERPNTDKESKSFFSYNAICQKTIKNSYAQLNYQMGHEGIGVAFSSGIGDGVYPVYARFENIGTKEKPDLRIAEVKISML